MKRVLVTGATGFIGRHCVGALAARGFQVHAVSSKPTRDDNPDTHWHRADLFDAARVQRLFSESRPTHLLHLAWITTPGKYVTSLRNLDWVEASIRLVKAFRDAGGRRVVMAGTCAEYDWKYGYCREGITPLKPATYYGQCKHALRQLVESYSQQVGLSAAWARIFFVYGPHAHPARFPGCIMSSLLHQQIAPCSHGNQVRDFLHVRDAGDAIAALLDSELAGGVNVASGCPVRLKDVALGVADAMGRPDLIRLGAIPAPPDEPPLLVADVRRLASELGWTPRFELIQGLNDTIDWWTGNQYRYAS